MEQLTKRSLVSAVCLAAAASTLSQPARGAEGQEAQVIKATLPLIVYDNANTEGEAPYVPSGWMGNTDAIMFDDAWVDKPHSGDSCIKVTYDSAGKWAGIVWQSPADDWGEEPGGYNLTGAKKLTFWARGDKGGEMVEFKAGIYPKSKPYYDTAAISLGKVKLSPEWRSYSIDLAGKNLERIKSGFVFSVAGKKEPITFYLDDIQYE